VEGALVGSMEGDVDGMLEGEDDGEVEARLYPSRSDTVSPARTNIPVGLSPKILT